MRHKYTYPKPSSNFQKKLVEFSKRYTYSSILFSGDNLDKYSKFNTIAALGSKEIISSSSNSFKKLLSFHNHHKDWMFGFLSYDIKNEIEGLKSENIDQFKFPNLEFFIPETILFISDEDMKIESFLSENKISGLLEEINNFQIIQKEDPDIELNFRETKEEFLKKIESIKKHIHLGDIYEMNYCQELFSKGNDINPSSVFWELNLKSNAPFSVFSKMRNKYLLCSSPERFLQKSENNIISQPIKGTRKRGKNKKEDQELIFDLQKSEKDRSENIMIADLVRNDLSRTAEKSSVKAEEICKIYTFDRVHQMISTISSILDEKYNFVDVLETTFPMGSMTGAPKIKSMELIEKYETTKRSLFSAAYGYITPNADFDFNVVIRSILYDKLNNYISVMVGGAITINSDPKSEYEECLIKAEAMIDVLKNEK